MECTVRIPMLDILLFFPFGRGGMKKGAGAEQLCHRIEHPWPVEYQHDVSFANRGFTRWYDDLVIVKHTSDNNRTL